MVFVKIVLSRYIIPVPIMQKESHTPLFSIIVPTLGKVDQWLEAIHSVQQQTLQDWEIVAVDAGDESISHPRIEKLNEARIIYINNAKGNPRLNWDIGYRHAKGKYVIWLDDDNYLLPHALETLAKVIHDHEQPDMVTAEHMHYRGLQHYISAYHNQLVIPLPLFTGSVTRIDPRDIIRRLMGWPQLTPVRARFHMTETAVKKSIADTLIDHIGEINFETTSTHSLRLGVLALSKEVYVIDSPIALVGQIGHALSYTWPRIDSPVLKKVKYNLSLSPLSALTYSNYRLENMLRTKDRLGTALADMEVNLLTFVTTYRRELVAFSQTWREWFQNWRNVTQLVQKESSLQPLRAGHGLFIVKGFVVQCARKLHLYDVLLKVLVSERMSKKNALTIELESYKITGMQSCAESLPTLIEHELHTPYTKFISIQS